MIQICAFKKKEKKEGEGRSQFGGIWKVLSLVAFGETSCLVAFGRRRKNIIFISFHFPPLIKFTYILFFIDFKVLLYHGFRSLLYVFPCFSLAYKLQPHISMYKIFHTFITKLILITFFAFP